MSLNSSSAPAAEAPSRVERTPAAAEAPSANALRSDALSSMQNGSANKAFAAMTAGSLAGLANKGAFSPFDSKSSAGHPKGALELALNDMDYAEKALISPSEKPTTLSKTISEPTKVDKSPPKSDGYDKASAALVVADGKEYLHISDPYTLGKAQADKKYGFAA